MAYPYGMIPDLRLDAVCYGLAVLAIAVLIQAMWKPMNRVKVKCVQVLGETLAVLRSEDGTVHIYDAYCPHLGANFAAGGQVKNGQLECPFHGWTFDVASGNSSSVPYSFKGPRCNPLRRWNSRELHGQIFLWYDAENRDPAWEIPVLENIRNGKLIYGGRTEHEALCHIQEIPENGADLAHINYLHAHSFIRGADLSKVLRKSKLMDFTERCWEGTWSPSDLGGDTRHIANVRLSLTIKLFKGLLTFSAVKVRADQIGPGIVHIRITTPFLSGVCIQTVLPVEPFKQRIIHRFYASSRVYQPLVNLILLQEAIQNETL